MPAPYLAFRIFKQTAEHHDEHAETTAGHSEERGAVGDRLGVLGFATTLTLGFAGVVDGVGLLDALGMGIRIGVVGGVAGALFSSVISVFYRGRSIRDISWVRFGLGGAVVSAVGLPLFMETMSIMTGGGPVPWRNIATDVVLFAAFGGVAAALSMKLAHIAAKRDADTDIGEGVLLDDGEPEHRLTAGEGHIPVPQRARMDAKVP
jgi:hypothetical protein